MESAGLVVKGQPSLLWVGHFREALGGGCAVQDPLLTARMGSLRQMCRTALLPPALVTGAYPSARVRGPPAERGRELGRSPIGSFFSLTSSTR